MAQSRLRSAGTLAYRLLTHSVDVEFCRNPSLADLQYVEELLSRIERQGIPAPSPIEQRWTSSSRSALSPASVTPELPPDTLFSWVGVIMYLPTENEKQRKAITNRHVCISLLSLTSQCYALFVPYLFANQNGLACGKVCTATDSVTVWSTVRLVCSAPVFTTSCAYHFRYRTGVRQQLLLLEVLSSILFAA